MIDQVTKSTIEIKKCRISPDQRMLAKELLLAHFPKMLNSGQLIIHFGPGRNPVFVELQERHDSEYLRLQQTG